MKKFVTTVFAIICVILGFLVIGGAIAGYIDRKKYRNSTHKSNGIYESYFKRVIDFMCGILALIMLWPLFLVIAVLVRVKLGTPVLFMQDRPGQDEEVFKLYKFRTMTDEIDEKGEPLPDVMRLTKFGQWLRSTSLDELPEVFNIIRGDMSMIGPRPLLIKYLPYYSEEQHHRHDVKPGLSGYAQAHGRNNISWEDKFAMDIEYTKNITFLGDVKIILDTIFSVLKKEGISPKYSVSMEDFADHVVAKQNGEI